MKQKLFKCLTSNTMSSVMSSVMSRVSNECRMTLDRVSTLLLLFFALSFGFNQEAKAKEIYAVDYSLYGASTYCHNWGGSTGTTWPGTKMTKWNTMKAGGCDIYYCTLAASNNNKVIFHNNNGSQTSDLSFESKYPQPTYANGSWWFSPRVAAAIWGSENNCSAGSHFYFNNTTTNWSDSKLMMIYGDDKNSSVTELTKITNTKLYHASPSKWDKLKYITIVGGSSLWGGGSWGPNNVINATHYTDAINYRYDANNTYYVTPNNSSNCTPISIDYKSGGYSDLNKTQTVKVMVKAAGGSYTEKAYGYWPATIKAKRYKLNSNGASKADETDADLTSANFTSVITSVAKIYVPTPNTGYTFKGWGTSPSSIPSNASSAYEYTVEDTKTIYLFFDENTYSVTAAKGTGCASVNPTGAQTVGQLTGKQFTATGETGYHFVDWTSSNGGTFTSSTSETTTFKPTAAATITANYAENTYTVSATYGDGGASATVTTSPAGQVTGTAISATAADGYIFSGWTITEGDGSFADAKSASTTYYPTSASELKATFARSTVTVNSGISGHATLSGSSTSHDVTIGTDTNVPGDEDVTFTVFNLDNGYQIEGWYTNSDYTEDKHDAGQSTYILESTNPNKNVYVKITPITYTITYNENGGTEQTNGTYTIESDDITLPTSTEITRTNYTFLGWFDNSGLTGDAVTTIPTGSTGNKQYWAKWEETKYAVTLVGAQSPVSPVQVGNVTDVQIVANTPTPGYYFVNWTQTGSVTIADANSATTTIKATGEGTVTANFAERFYLRGSSTADKEPTKGMPGWGDDAKESGKGLFTNIDGSTATIKRTLEAATEYKLKLGDLQGNYSWGANSAYEFTNDADLWTFTSHDKNCEAPTFKTAIAGTYTFTIDFSEASPKMKITYPTPDFTLQVAKTRVYEESTLTFIDGDGSQENPYQFYLDEKMHLEITALPEVTGVQAMYQFGEDAASSTTLVKDINATTTKQSIVVKAYYKSTIGSYQSAEKTQTIWYQGVRTPALHLTASWNEKEESELSDNPQVTIYYSTDHYNGAATVTQSTDGGEPTEFMTITTEKQKNQTYQMANNQPHRYDFAASATVNERSFVAATSVSIYRLVEVRVKDTNHRMTKYYMWINGSNPLQEEAAWPGNDFIGKLGDWHIFLVKYPSYTHFVLNNGKNGDEEGAAQTVDVQLPVTNTCYEIGAKGGDNKYAVTVAGACPDKLYVGDIANVTLHQGESQLITPDVDLDFGYNESQLQITFPNLPNNFTAVQQGKNFMLTGADQCGATSIKVIYTLDGYSVEKTFSATVTHPSNILIQVAINTSYGWNAKDQIRIMYFNHGLDGEKNMTWHHYANDEDYFYAKIPVGTDGKVDFLVHAWDFEKEHMDHQTTNMENVDMPGCFYVSNDFYDGKRGIARRGDDCWEEYQVVINMANGKTYYSNKVENLNDIVSFYAPGKDETGNKSGLVRILRNGTQVATISANTFTKSGIYTAKITANGEGLSDVASYTGDFYIRTDGAEGGWNNYTKESHKFTYFTPYEGALYDYYWVQNIKRDNLNIHACIGNDYNENLANKIENSDYTDGTGNIKPDAGTGVNLRFGYNPETNYFERSILRGSTAGSNNFLNIVGNNIFNDDDCTKELNESNYTAHPEWSKFGDISNWVYEKNVYVKIDGSHQYANALLKSKFNENIIYQLGYTRDPITGAETRTPAQRDILSIGTTNRTYNIRVIYDFKTNRIVSAWSPISDLDIENDLTINADVLFVRHEEENVAQVNLKNNAAKVSSLNDAYFVLEIDGSTAEKKKGESMYWLSVPFDCEISSIFGVEGYVTLDGNGNPTAGTWGIQEYDGKSRAEKGWYAETATFWRWMRKNETLKKGHGYILVFDRSDANDKGLWKAISREEPCEGTGDGCVDGKKTVTTTVLRLYFPSSESGWQMTRSGEEQWVEYENWTCEKKDRKAQDSNWRLLGTDSYSNICISRDAQFNRTDNDSVLNKAPYFVYEYHAEKEAYKRYEAVTSIGTDFKSFYCYMVQFSGRINWNQYTQSIPEHVAARRIVSENEITNAQMTLSLKKGDATEDNTYIYMDARATTDFDNQMDLTKIIDTRANQVYSVVNGVEYAGNTLPVESQTIPLTVNINASGTYTFSMPDGTSGVSATLIDAQDGSRTDLSMWDYTVDLKKGTFAGRFFIEIDIRKTPTQIDVTNPDMLDENGNPIKTVKFLHEDQLYIQRGQHIYDATGKVVK